LLLLSSSPEMSWTVESIYERLRSNRLSIQRRLQTLTAQGLVEVLPEDHYRYRPVTAELRSAVHELAEAYREFRVTVIETIFSKPTTPIQDFADAFRIRKEPKDG